ncbi:hisA/hisF family protein [Archaeoglobus sulfaticallidus PM70-1]|uniref:HisA/hisF family protein n=1 Tax=Archaeoglobus sulfaticallidus PM70-1 TaxID=387631 RepID=N0BCL4_9EURY|nr:HisA/HisF family protein [Archaeoglobus sulfaticallidus]AGK60748.1 hisA/hisF family protein [Archaeoglobus sulfaticallidus PM70-1]
MKLYFVMDIKNGIVVRGVKGDRESYKPVDLESLVVKSSIPVQVFDAVKPKHLYIADLNRIMGMGDNLKIIEELGKKAEIIADCGFKSPEEVHGAGFTPVLGSETFDLKRLEEIKEREVVVSLDIMDSFVDASGSFEEIDEAVKFLNSFRLKGLIVLTIRRVGTSSSLDWDLIGKILGISDNPVFAGGGIRDLQDVMKAKDIGLDGVLVATAVHNGKIPLELIRNGEV